MQYKYMEIIKDISIKYKYTRNNKILHVSINDKDGYEEKQRNIYKCQIYTLFISYDNSSVISQQYWYGDIIKSPKEVINV